MRNHSNDSTNLLNVDGTIVFDDMRSENFKSFVLYWLHFGNCRIRNFRISSNFSFYLLNCQFVVIFYNVALQNPAKKLIFSTHVRVKNQQKTGWSYPLLKKSIRIFFVTTQLIKNHFESLFHWEIKFYFLMKWFISWIILNLW